MLKKINFVTEPCKLREMAYGDSVYAWLLLHSHYSEEEDHNYIYENEFSFVQIAADIRRCRQAVSNRFKELLKPDKKYLDEDGQIVGRPLLVFHEKGKYYTMPCFKQFEKLDAETVLNLFWLCGQGNTKRKEELIKLYAWLKKVYKSGNKHISLNDILETTGQWGTNETTYAHYKDVLTTLQGAGLIKFRTTGAHKPNGQFEKSFYVYQVNDKASQEWLDKRKEDENKNKEENK